MQPVANRRALSYIASKLHPRAPLSPRESAQLLNLLTTSFRAHLDRAHPVAEAENGKHDANKQSFLSVSRRRARSVPPARLHSSHMSTRDHIESILTNPLFTTRPGRRASDASKADAESVLRDPLGWFLDQVAMGAADLSKAGICLHMLQKDTGTSEPDTGSGKTHRLKPASQIANWLQCSGPDTWSQFISHEPEKLLHPLVRLLLREGEDAIVWKWFAATSTSVQEKTFRAQLLRVLVMAKTREGAHINEGLSVFLRASKMVDTSPVATTLQPAGFYLVNRILSHPNCARSARLYESFLRTVKAWSSHPRSIQLQSILWLHHPTEPTAHPAITYIKDPEGMAQAKTQLGGKEKFLVHLCLAAARQLLAEKRFDDAQFALEFARDTFPDLVGSPSKPLHSGPQAVEQKEQEREALDIRRRREEASLRMLDRLLPT